MPSPTRIGRLLRRWRREHGSLELMAPRLGVNKNTLAMYERGERLPGVDFLARFARDLDVPFEELLEERLLSSPEPTAQALAPMAASGSVTPAGGYVPVPALGRAGAREGEGGEAMPPLAFSRDWLTAELGLEPSRAAHLEMEGDTMEPTLRPGALLLLDRTLGERAGLEGVYALHLDGELMVKRVQRLPDRRLKLSCDNPAYEDFHLPLEGGDPVVELLGQVVWVGRRL